MGSGVDIMNKEMIKKYFLNWEETARYTGEETGGKGQNLGRLHRYGFQVPAGGVLVTASYREFLQYNDLEHLVQAADAVKADDVLNSEKLLEEIREKINNGQIGEDILHELAEKLAGMELLGRAVAVRSSASAEDSISFSFAGIHESFLNVTGLENIIRAVKGCYASLWTPRAVAYRRKMGLSDDKVAAAVVIMELVPAEAAGVAFSCNPRTGQAGLDRHQCKFRSWRIGGERCCGTG